MDFVTSARSDAIARALAPLGFEHVRGRREFTHPDTDLYLEFPPGPLAFGETVVSDGGATVIETRYGPLRIVTPTQSVMDRLAHYIVWHDNQALDQAIMVARRCSVNWPELEAWAKREGAPADVLVRLRTKASRTD